MTKRAQIDPRPDTADIWTRILVLEALWLPVALSCVYLKYLILQPSTYRPVWASLLHSSLPSALDQLSFFRTDLLWDFLLVPAAVASLAVFRSRYVPRVLAVLSVMLLLIFFFEENAFRMIGRFLSPGIVNDTGRWIGANPGDVTGYLNWSTVARLVMGIAIIVICASGLFGRLLGLVRRERGTKLLFAALLEISLMAIVLLTVRPSQSATRFHASIWSQMGAAWRSDTGRGLTIRQTLDQVKQQYAAMTHVAPSAKPDSLFGRARGYNVILVILETMPGRFLRTDQPLDGLPNLNALRRQSYVSRLHLSTYPITTRAVFSIYTSMYPLRANSDWVPLVAEGAPHLPGLIDALNSAGYTTGAYLGGGRFVFQEDVHLYAGCGFTRVETSRLAGNRLDMDRDVLNRLEADVRSSLHGGKRFAVAFLPQLTHGPWPRESIERGDEGLRTQAGVFLRTIDSWLGELIQLLRDESAYDRTLILVTGDHGFRNSQEDPHFVAGYLNEISYNVPLMLYAPGILESPEVAKYPTSHIDIAPSILDLLGIDARREYEQGMPMWSEALAGRRTFLWGKSHLAADGYYEAGHFFTFNPFTNAACEGRTLQCESEAPMAAPQIQSVIDSMSLLQEQWLWVSRFSRQ